MKQLHERDLRAVIAFLRDVQAQPDLDSFAHQVVRSLPGVVYGHRVSYNEAHVRRGTLRTVISPRDDVPPLTARQYEEHPMMQHFVRTADGRAHKFSDFLTRDELHATEMYQMHYERVGVEHQITVCLGSPDPHVVAFAVSRDVGDFTERDRAVLNLLRPHLAAAYDRSSAAARLSAQMAVLGRAAEIAAAGVVLLGRDRRIHFMTRRARHWLREYFPRRGRPSTRLPVAVADWLARQDPWAAPRNVAPPAAPLVVARADRRLTIRAVGPVAERALLLEESRESWPASALAPLGLTPRESEVLALAARGAGNDAIALALGAKTRTVAKHVERIYRKLGVDSRAAAAARAHEIAAQPPDLAD